MSKIPIEGNEVLINLIRRKITNGTIKGTDNVARTITEFVNRRRWNNSNNDSSKRTRKDIQTTGIRSEQDKQRSKNNQERNNNKSSRNKSRGINENSSKSSFFCLKMNSKTPTEA